MTTESQLLDEIMDIGREALWLAIARYLHDGHPLTDRARSSIWPEIKQLGDQPLEQHLEEVELCRLLLADWKQRVQAEHPDLWKWNSTRALHAGYALDNAETGFFGTSTGAVNDFLNDAGAPTQHFDVF